MKTTPVSIILVLVIPSFLASAEPEQRGQRPSFQAKWEEYDADGDGFLSLEEFQAMPRVARLPEEKQIRLFERLDKNSDGRISREELGPRRNAGDVRQRPARGMRRLMELDADGSGGVSLEEFRAAEMFANFPPERVEALFRRLDTDGDGKITPKDRPELPPMMRQPPGPRGDRQGIHRRIFNQLDQDGSGMIDFEQFRKARGISTMEEDEQKKRFLRLDVDRDGKLSIDEFSRIPLAEIAPSPMRNGDGRQRGRAREGAGRPGE